MSNNLIRKVFGAFTLLFLFLQYGCYYSYSVLRREIVVGNDSIMDLQKKSTLYIQYTGATANILYKAKQKIPDDNVEWLAYKTTSKKEFKDSLKDAGILFKEYGKGCGWTKRLEEKCLHVENEAIVKIDSAWNVYMDDSVYNGARIRLDILADGNTVIIPNCESDALKIIVTVKGKKVNAVGEKKMHLKHIRNIFYYIFGN